MTGLAPDPKNEAPPRDGRPMALLVAAALSSVIFGDYAQEVAQWAVCLHSDLVVGDRCKDRPVREALMIGTFVSTLSAVFAAAYAGRWGDETPRAAALLVVGALAGALLALLKAAEGDGKYPAPDLLARPLLIYALTAGTLLGTFALVRPDRRADRFSLLQRVTMTLLIGAAIGGVMQGGAELVWQGNVDRFSSSKFVVSPIAVAAGGAAFGVLALDPWLRGTGAHPIWPVGWLTVALAAASSFVFLDYLAKHGPGWVERAQDQAHLPVAVTILALLMGGIVASALSIPGDVERLRTRLFIAMVPAAALGGLAGWELAYLRETAGAMIRADCPVLVAATALTVASVPLTIRVTDWLHGVLLHQRGG